MKSSIGLTLYSILWYFLAPWVLLRLWLKGRHQPAYRQRLAERFGRWPASIPPGCLWVHAVSVGETIAAKGLIEQWQQTHPDVPILVTSMTPTGSETVQRLFGDSVHHAYLPWDFSRLQRRLVKRLSPKLLVIMETELWPNLIHACALANVPVMVANARLSERSRKGYARFRGLTTPMLKEITAIAAQHAPDAERFAQLGVDSKCLQVTGSIKFDINIDAHSAALARQLQKHLGKRPVWIAASTHDGEEDRLLAIHAKLKVKMPNALLILVPRHPERADRIAGQLYKQHFQFGRRSHDNTPKPDDSVFLVDTLGEMMTFFELADAAFIGNTLNQGGGHNPIEPAALATPVLIGPSYFNFQTIVDAMLTEHAIVVVQDDETLYSRLQGLLQSKDLRDTYGQRAYLFYQQQQGALKRLMTWIEDLIAIPDSAQSPLKTRNRPSIMNEDHRSS